MYVINYDNIIVFLPLKTNTEVLYRQQLFNYN